MKTRMSAVIAAAGLLISGAALADHHGGGMHSHHGKDARMPMFGLFDENKDGKLSKDEVQRGIDKMFAEADTDKDGLLSQDEMQSHHAAIYDKMRSQMQAHWKAADKDGDGALSRAEVDAAKMPRLSRDFDRLDANKDGKLTPDEMRSAMMQRHQGGAATQTR